jgi:hypothetical protein
LSSIFQECEEIGFSEYFLPCPRYTLNQVTAQSFIVGTHLMFIKVKDVLREGALVTYLAVFWAFAVFGSLFLVRRMHLTNPILQVNIYGANFGHTCDDYY